MLIEAVLKDLSNLFQNICKILQNNFKEEQSLNKNKPLKR